MKTLPEFSLQAHDGRVVTTAQLAGKRVLIFFYPAASTPGCTKEACDFRDNYQGFIDAGIEIVGVSPDQPAANAKFRDDHGFPFDLLSDVDHRLAEKLGAWGQKKNYGREYEGLIRSTFLFGPDGAVETEYRNVKAAGHVDRLVRELL